MNQPEQNKIIQCVKQSYPTISIDDIFEWFGNNNISFLYKDDTESLYNSKKAFTDYFDVIYTDEGLVFVKPNCNKKIKFWDPMDRLGMDNREENYDIHVFMMYFHNENNVVEQCDVVELYKYISRKYFEENIYNKTGIRKTMKIDD